ncbi:MAG TPA: hypothetical protein VLT33_34645, partial [Labilithrix sp.]|nr:hypothetical protein [Labilithrix sp.]
GSLTAARAAFLANYTGKGGHVLINHHAADAIFYAPLGPPSWLSTSTFQNPGSLTPYKMLVKVGSPPQQQFYDWLNTFGGMVTFGAPYISIPEGTKQALVPVPALTTVWLGGQTSNAWSGGPPPTNQDFTGSYSFEMGNVATVPTPAVNCGVPGGFGRVFFNGMHVSPTRGTTSGTFPGSCNLGPGLTEAERAFEFHIFQLTACQLGGSPPPPAAPPLPTTTYFRDYQAVCGPGERVKWAPFYWQGVIPAGTSINFRAATADMPGLLPAVTPFPTAPASANVATASATVTAPTWDCQGCPATPVTVESQLQTDTGTLSKEYLRIYMKFNPSGTVGPILNAWRQVYDCIPAE